MITKEPLLKTECYYCHVLHKSVECHGMYYCPNPLCTGPGGGWFRNKLKSYEETGGPHDQHSVDQKEWNRKAEAYIKKEKLKLKFKKTKPQKCNHAIKVQIDSSIIYENNKNDDERLPPFQVWTKGFDYCPDCGVKFDERNL